MPVSIRTEQMKFKEPSSNDYVTIDMVSDQTTESRVNEINAAAATAVAAIEAKESSAVANVADAAEVQEMIANIYNTTSVYKIGDYAIYDDETATKLYTCIDATSGTWDNSKWQETQLSDKVKNTILQSAIAINESSTTAESAHTAGTYFTMNGSLFEATKDIAVGDTISVGTNCKKITSMDIITLLSTNMNFIERDIDTHIYSDLPYILKPNAIMSNGKWRSNIFEDESHICIPISPGDDIEITANNTRSTYFAYLTDDNWQNLNTIAAFAGEDTNRHEIAAKTTYTGTAPENSNYLYITISIHNNTFDYSPSSIKINNLEHRTSLLQKINAASADTLNNLTTEINTLSNAVNGQKITVITDRDANNINTNGCYYYGSSDGAQNVIPKASAGYILHFNRDDNTAYQLGLKYQDTTLWIRGKKVGIWGNWTQLGAEDSTTPSTSTPTPMVKYEAGSFLNGLADKKLFVYLPSNGKYVCYQMYHCVDNAKNCNVWRIGFVYSESGITESGTELFRTGELECAIKLSGRSDFSGGSTHGDEIETGITFMLDGQVISDLSTLATAKSFTELRIVRQSTLYDPNDSTTPIAEHGCEYVYTEDGLKINQSIKWLVAESLENCFLAMCTINKSVTDHVYTDVDFTPIALTEDNFSYVKNGVKKAVIYGTNSGVVCEFAIERYPTEKTGGDQWSVKDNGGLNYNKMYYYIARSGASSTVGELWQSTTSYKIHLS